MRNGITKWEIEISTWEMEVTIWEMISEDYKDTFSELPVLLYRSVLLSALSRLIRSVCFHLVVMTLRGYRLLSKNNVIPLDLATKSSSSEHVQILRRQRNWLIKVAVGISGLEVKGRSYSVIGYGEAKVQKRNWRLANYISKVYFRRGEVSGIKMYELLKIL